MVPSLRLCPCHVQWTSFAKKWTSDFVCKKCRDSHTGLTQGMANLKIDTNYEDDVSSILSQGMEELSITSPCMEPSSPTKDETFYRRIDETYEKAILWKNNSFDSPHGNTVKHFVQEADRILQQFFKNPFFPRQSV